MCENGFKTFYVRPEVSERFDYVDMQYDSPKGTIGVNWKKVGDGYSLYVKVPFDCEAIVKVPWQEDELVLLAGEYDI